MSVPVAGSPPMKYVVVAGGTVSGLGKGTAISSLGVVLKSHGFRVTAMKIDPYLNVDAGTMSPYEHGEVYVLDDGGEADLDLGNYERFLDINLTARHNITSGKIYKQIIERERKGDYLGKTVQMIPHVTDAVQDWIESVAYQPVSRQGGVPHICLVELGGTVGDIESAVYLEAIQQFQARVGPDNFCMILVGLVPVMGVVGEQKTKPCQHSVKQLREAGLKPDLVFCRMEKMLEDATRKKISMFCQVDPACVVSLHDVTNIFHVPLLMEEQNVGALVLKKLSLDVSGPPKFSPPTKSIGKVPFPLEAPALAAGLELMAPGNLVDWRKMAERCDNPEGEVTIAIVGKYTGLQDSYLSVLKALRHACTEVGCLLTVVWIESTDLEGAMKLKDPQKYELTWSALKACDGVLVPGGFGDRGIEGKAVCARYCRDANIPYLGICLGMQTAVISFAKDVLGWEDANSTEFDEKTEHPVVVFMPEINANTMGGTMRLGSRVTILRDPNSLAYKLYGGQPVIYERHRHRYEVNNAIVPVLQNFGMVFSGQDERGQRMEILEIPELTFFLGCQFHPEYK